MKLKHARKNSGFTLVELLVVIAIIAVLASISTPIVLRKVSQANATIAQSNAKDIYKGVVEYALNNGTFAPLVTTSSNESLRPYFVTSTLVDEGPFFVNGTAASFPSAGEGDGNIAAAEALSANENVFAYFGPATGATGWNHSTAPARSPLLATPVTTAGASYATMAFGPDFSGFGVILNVSGGADRVSINAGTNFAVDAAGAALAEPADTAGMAVAFAGALPL